MKTFRTQRTVSHSPDDMFDLVADVESYPEFVPLCESLRVRSCKEHDGRVELEADMTVSFKLFRDTFCSRVRLDRDARRIDVSYVDGPFREMRNRWMFRPNASGCEIDFFLQYELRSRSLQMIVGGVFDRAFSRFSSAFERRADEIYRHRQPQADGGLAPSGEGSPA